MHGKAFLLLIPNWIIQTGSILAMVKCRIQFEVLLPVGMSKIYQKI